ncbi:hypothetical protein GIB67_001370 [Kingdonia uniflora]|uniref:Crossover junction endonuclease MUS81 n=1 Tax=Kingdonia uniflora TaxID=39325 RepID=A0A7J7NMT1_9MAGN|nr:hypothetical protein GIB67_001370 [Kingdonia uniflora]
MEKEKRVVCIDNESLASFMFKKKQQLADPKSNSDRVDSTIYKAYIQVCNTKTPITTIKEFFQINEEGEIARRYVSQKNSVPYALLITLYREKEKGNEFMKKQELIDAAEASGLSRARTGSGKVGRNGASGKELYSGWTFMKTMLTKGLVVKSSCPAKYILSQEGLEAANDCLLRSGLADHAVGKVPSQDLVSASDMEFACTSLADEEVSILSVDLRSQGKSVDVPAELFERGLVPNLVPCDDNAMPTTIPDNEEVQKTVFQMEGDSSSSLDALPGFLDTSQF